MDTYEKNKLLAEIWAEMPNFDEDQLLEYTKIVIPNIHKFLSQENLSKASKYCSQKLIEKILSNKNTYRISKNMDNVVVQYARLDGYSTINNKLYIKMYTSVFFYDDVDNNINNEEGFDKYWNDIWIITYELNDNPKAISTCSSCGATMEYNRYKHLFTCNYCKNSVHYSQTNWEMVDITKK